MGFAFGISYFECAHIRGAYGLSGMGALPTAAELVVQPLTALAVAHARALLLPPPQPAIIKDNTNIMANRPIFSMKPPCAGTVNETERPISTVGSVLIGPRYFQDKANIRTSLGCSR